VTSPTLRPQTTSKTGARPSFVNLPLTDIRPAPVNDLIYGAIDPDSPSLDALAESLREHGQFDPIIISIDHVIISGHRRFAVARRLGWTHIKAVCEPIHSTDPNFATVVVTCNEQRDKTPDVRVREQLVLTDPADAHRALVSRRAEAARVKVAPLVLGDRRKRHRISNAKKPFLDAVLRVLDDLGDYWPLTDRTIHYALLNEPPLRHASKPASTYLNKPKDWKDLTGLLTRARLEGLIPFEAIGDETRPVSTWDAHPNVTPYVRREVDGFLKGYWRDLMQGQPNHIEVVGEKMTVEGVVRPVAADFCIPYTIGRGYSSLPPRKAMFDRYQRSGKAKLIILFLSDHDPEGDDIPTSFGRSMRDDFGVENIHTVKVGLTHGQVAALGLPPNTDADNKKKGSRYKRFVTKYGPAVYELEAVSRPTLQGWLRDAIHAVIDTAAFNAQVDAEKQDATTIEAYRKAAIKFFAGLRVPAQEKAESNRAKGGEQ
jgi:hypothetical protein